MQTTLGTRRTVKLSDATVELQVVTCGDVKIERVYHDGRLIGSVQKIGGRWSAATRTGRSVKRLTHADALVGLLTSLGVR